MDRPHRVWQIGQKNTVICLRDLPGNDRRAGRGSRGRQATIADITLPKSSSIGDLDAEQLQQALGIDCLQLLEMGSDDVVEVTA